MIDRITTERLDERTVRVKIEVKGYIYACTFHARPGFEPTNAEIRRDFRVAPKTWLPFDESTGTFLKGGVT